MSTSVIAPLSYNGRTLVTIIGEVLRSMFASKNSRAPNAAPVEGMSIWQLYRLTAGYDSISPKVAAELRRKLVGS